MAKKDEVQDFEFVGADDGFAYTKIVTKDKYIKVRSMVRSGLHPTANILGEGVVDTTGGYETEGLKYTAGDQVNGEDTRFDGYIGSPLNRVVVHHALHQAGFAGRDVKIATGLPVDSFYLPDGSINNELIKAKRDSMAKPVLSLGGDASVNVLGNIVCSEGVAAWLDYVLDMEGNPVRDMASYPVGVVDIGGRTTDCVWVSPPSSIDHSRSGTENVGVLDVLKAVGNALQANYELQNTPRWALEQAVTTGKARIFGKDQDVSAVVNEAVNSVTERIMREVERRLGNGAELDAVIFVGGGAAMMPKIAERYKNAVIPENPEFANARGMYKYLRYISKNK